MLRNEPANDCHQMTFLTTRSTARILIMNLRHRQTLPLTRPAVSSRGGLTRHERAAEIEPKKNGTPSKGKYDNLDKQESAITEKSNEMY